MATRTDDGNGCSTVCQRDGVCGDGIVQPLFEVCDDGFTDACGTCNADCTGGTGAVCGDGDVCPESRLVMTATPTAVVAAMQIAQGRV